jgi:hypothetical protein
MSRGETLKSRRPVSRQVSTPRLPVLTIGAAVESHDLEATMITFRKPDSDSGESGGAAVPSIMHRRNSLMNSLVTVASVASATATAAPADISPATAVTADFDMAAFRGRFELIIETLRTQYVCVGWKMDEIGAKEALESIQEDDAGPTYEFVRFMQDHGQSFEWLYSDRVSSMITALAAKSLRASRCMTAGDHSDKELLSLGKEMKACHRRLMKAYKACSQAEMPADDQRRQRICAAEEISKAIHTELWGIGRKIFATPANTPAGLIVKADAAKQMALCEELGAGSEAFWWRSIQKDIRRMAAARDR